MRFEKHVFFYILNDLAYIPTTTLALYIVKFRSRRIGSKKISQIVKFRPIWSHLQGPRGRGEWFYSIDPVVATYVCTSERGEILDASWRQTWTASKRFLDCGAKTK
jgi:hypothetical protein